ncbi:DNA polymerase-3 subunit epsilon [Pararhizobium capsulatum DSM 1112]|uniref:DNA polymerase-3 subunit epsilon n=1 Tax=Pararhizobium capsulatum DSM 1112 TaxID=1121113 RepID=A0ABU0C354_9HYPH|nr:3'-5' exonuclease [Pararhizobium capsulatum]MDQ0323527.1 DNA polymerase-3 subunit epsilon [Pararhizobium capsulatum DSM 1112]
MSTQYDMFEIEQRPAPTGNRPGPRRPVGMSEDDMVRYLQATGRYRILSKLESRRIVTDVDDAFPLRGIVLDTETTGLNARKDEIIEIGLVAFSFNAVGQVGEVHAVYGGLQEPSGPIPAEITRLTGITDADVAGQMINMAQVKALVGPADLIIAHNAGFDRPFCEAFSPIFADKAWACSVSEVDWAGRGFEGTKLGYLIGQAGYFHEGHRAVDDCHALLEVLDQKVEGSSITPFSELYRASQKSRVRIYAEHSPFDLKEHLKGRGYRWSDGSDGRPKSWWIEVDEHLADDELAWLQTDIYRYDANPPMQSLSAFDRFKA